MPLVFPTRVGREAVAVATAARHLDDGPDPLGRLMDHFVSLDCQTVHAVALMLARIVGFQNTDEELQKLALEFAVENDAVGL
jgi:hypothetical protein